MQYFFNVRSGSRSFPDTEGGDFPSLHSACAEATSVARELIARSLIGDEAVDWSGAIDVMAEDRLVAVVSFTQAAGFVPPDY